MIKEQIRYLKQRKKIFTGNLKNYQLLIIIFIINLLFFYIFYGGTIIFSDLSRELYIPMAMNKGDILYKDIFNVYAPFGYQLNAFLINIFGENLRTFYAAGFINSTLILFGLFYILKLFVKQGSLLILSVLFSVITMCIYAVSQTNYITPYSYSIVYALNSFIWAITALLYYIKENKNISLYLSFFFFGTSLSFKYEFFPFAIVLFAVLIYKKVNIKIILTGILLFFTVPFLSITDLLLRGVSFNVLKEAVTYMLLLAKAKSVNILYTYLGFIPTISSLKVSASYFIQTLSFLILIGLYLVLITKTINKLILKGKRNLLLPAGIIFTSVFLIFLFLTTKTLVVSNAFYFNWIGIFTIVLFIFFCTRLIRKYIEKSIESYDILFFTLFFSTILCSFKCIFNISFNTYGTYYFPLLFICCTLYIYIYKIERIKRKQIRYITALIILTTIVWSIGCIYYFSNLERFKQTFGFYTIKTHKGILKPGVEMVEPLNDTVNYINHNTSKNDTVLVLPEGAVINFLTDRKSNNKYFYLIPPNIEIFVEENIVKDLENNLPDYLIIQPLSYNNFKETFFCESFGTKICEIIPLYYEKPIVFGKNFWLAIYKRKELNNEK